MLSEEADFYKCTDYHHPSSERGIAWDDPKSASPGPCGTGLRCRQDQRNGPLAAQRPEDPVYEG